MYFVAVAEGQLEAEFWLPNGFVWDSKWVCLGLQKSLLGYVCVAFELRFGLGLGPLKVKVERMSISSLNLKEEKAASGRDLVRISAICRYTSMCLTSRSHNATL